MQNISQKLMACGIRRTVSNVVELLVSDFDWHKFRDIERKADLRQPEVSMAIKEILPYVEVRTSNEKREEKGRPTKEFRLTEAAANGLIKSIVASEEEKIEKIRKSLDDLAQELSET